MILIALASATIVLIRNNQPLIDTIKNADRNGDSDKDELQLIVAHTQNLAYWLIFLSGCIFICKKIALILLLIKTETGRIVQNILVSCDNY